MSSTDKHFILRGQLVGEDTAWADCKCGWSYEGTNQSVHDAAKQHMTENENTEQTQLRPNKQRCGK